MRLTIATRAVVTISLLIALSLGLVGLYLVHQEREAVVQLVVARLEALTSIVAADLSESPAIGDAWARRARGRTKARITVIASDGRVLADSDEAAAGMENHRHRPEVEAALAGGSGVAMRFSRTLGHDLLYYALRLSPAGQAPVILRLAVPILEVTHGSGEFRRRFLAIAALSLALGTGLALLWARGIARRLHQMVAFARRVPRGEFSPRLSVTSRDEFGDLAAALNAMVVDLQEVLRRLEDEGERSRTIVETMAEGLLVLDPRGRISRVNPAAERLLGVSGADVTGRTPLEVIRSVELDDLLRAAGGTERGARAEFTLLHPRRRILAGTAATMRDGQGNMHGTVLALRDITQLKRLEEMRMEFVLNVSHELRTPLTAIRGYAETLLDGGLADGENARKFLEIIHRHSERLGRLLNDLLELSNLELDRTPMERRPVAVADVVRQAIALLTPQAEQKRMRLESAVPDTLPRVLADRDRLVQVLVNLVDNAVKYTPDEGTVSVTARQAPRPTPPLPAVPALAAAPPTDCVEITVADTGIGIPQKDLPRLTERFYRVDRARSRELGGTGLGLAIVKHIVAAHGGELTIDSTLGLGTQVRVFLPVAPADSSATTAPGVSA